MLHLVHESTCQNRAHRLLRFFAQEYIIADDVITFCFYLMNEMRKNLIKIRSCAIFNRSNRFYRFLVAFRSVNVLVSIGRLENMKRWTSSPRRFSLAFETFSLVNSWCLRSKLKLACDLKSLSRNVIMQVLLPAVVIVLVPVQLSWRANRAYLL